MNKRILFIDPQANPARDLVSALAELEPEWELAHADNSRAAQARLRSEAFDAVVAELETPGLNGATLLREAIQHQPRALRFVLSRMDNPGLLFKCLGMAHQVLVRPCAAETLRAALSRAFALDVWLPNERVARLLGEMPLMPSPPHLYFQVARELKSEKATLEGIGELIARDPAMTALVLRAVNSAVFGLGKPVANPGEAVLYLGAEATQSMILLAHTYSYFDQLPGVALKMDPLWEHSLLTGCYARWIAREEGMGAMAGDEAGTAGMLHDIGKLILAANLSDRYRRVDQRARLKGLETWEAEQEEFGVNHAEVGACLAAVWGLPAAMVEALALHHHPARVVHHGVCPLTLVHVANLLAHADAGPDSPLKVDRDYLAQLGVADRVEAWREICRPPRNVG